MELIKNWKEGTKQLQDKVSKEEEKLIVDFLNAQQVADDKQTAISDYFNAKYLPKIKAATTVAELNQIKDDLYKRLPNCLAQYLLFVKITNRIKSLNSTPVTPTTSSI
jgi:hypothetical protein